MTDLDAIDKVLALRGRHFSNPALIEQRKKKVARIAASPELSDWVRDLLSRPHSIDDLMNARLTLDNECCAEEGSR